MTGPPPQVNSLSFHLVQKSPVRSHAIRGFSSTTTAHEIATLFSQVGKPIFVFYLGDHDPSGHDIERDVYEAVYGKGSGSFELRRLAIHANDIRKFHLPPLRVKESDPRAMAFLRQHGRNCVELDALPPEELRRRIREAIEEVIDREAWERAILLETKQRETTKRIANTLRSLTSIQGAKETAIEA